MVHEGGAERGGAERGGDGGAERGSDGGRGRSGGEKDGIDDGGKGRDAAHGSAAGGHGEGAPGASDDAISYAWNHAETFHNGFKCSYCGIETRSGGVTRLKQHLAGVKGDVRPCLHVPANVRRAMSEALVLGKIKKKAKQKRTLQIERDIILRMGGERAYDQLYGDYDEDMQRAIDESLMEYNYQQRVEQSGNTFQHGSRSSASAVGASGSGSGSVGGGSGGVIKQMFRKGVAKGFDADLARAKAPVQTRVDTIWSSNENKDMVASAWSKWFHANDIPGSKANCPYFVGAMKITQKLGEGVPIPKGQALDGPCLKSNYDELQEYVVQFKKDWNRYGVTVMCDAWTGPTDMSIVNFMLFCNGRMLFHKSANTTGEIQNAKYLWHIIRQVVVDEIGSNFVVQIVTDNGSNFKKACGMLLEEFPHMVWQPCCAHTVNLMLKDIGKFDEVAKVVTSAKRISRFFYNHSRLHAEMKNWVGGELLRPNATRFGTVFLFLQSFMDKKDEFRKWMVSDEWQNSEWSSEPDFDFAYDQLTSRQWWDNMKWVLDAVKPIYSLLRYADREKNATLSGFTPRAMEATQYLSDHFGHGSPNYERFLDVVWKRLKMLRDDTHLIAAGVLDPAGNYKYNICEEPEFVRAFGASIRKIAVSPESMVETLSQFEVYRNRRGIFDTMEARIAATRLSATSWWTHYGGEIPDLQKYALRIVSQCMSSSGCERNWSTFALIHTQLRNRLGYDKLEQLVFVHYNLKLRIQQQELHMRENEIDPCDVMMDATLYDRDHPIMDWLNGTNCKSKPIPEMNAEKSSDDVLNQPIKGWTTKRKHASGERKGRGKKEKKVDDEEGDVGSDDDTETPRGSPTYDDTDDSTSQDDDDHDGDGGDDQPEPIQFTCEENFTHATQDEDHGSRRTRPPRKSRYKRVSDFQSKGANDNK